MSQDAARPYSTELRKGRGAVAETLTLLGSWEPGMPSTELQALAVEQGIFGSSSAKRAQDLVSVVFARRYLADGGEPATYLKYLLECGADRAVLRQLMLVYTARRNPVLRDFISEVFWPAFAAGAEALRIGEAEGFLKRAAVDGRIARPWSEVMRKRIAGDLLSTLADFGLLEDLKRPTKPIRSYRLLPDTVLFLAHEIHLKGFSDNSILESPDWRLFGLAREDVVQQLDKVSRAGHYILQYSGDLLRISWRYQTMEECLDAIAGR
jgi:BrxA